MHIVIWRIATPWTPICRPGNRTDLLASAKYRTKIVQHHYYYRRHSYNCLGRKPRLHTQTSVRRAPS